MSTAPLLRSSSTERSDKICYEPSAESGGDEQDYLIFFLPGNPGLIPYYQPFLSRLHDLLVSSSSTASALFHICGHSLKGFEFTKTGQAPQSPLNLKDQIKYQEDLLYSHVKSHRDRTGNTPKVILMGHSVGAYILLELIRHHEDMINESENEDFDLIGGILLFPTITHIAKSPLGMVASVSIWAPHS
jgi:pimeloyl-ACP methyl ester carboxylesterase